MNFLQLTGFCLALVLNAVFSAQAGIWPWSEKEDPPTSQENTARDSIENEPDLIADPWTVMEAEDDLKLIEEGIHGGIPEPLESKGSLLSELGSADGVLENIDATLDGDDEVVSRYGEEVQSDVRRLTDELRALENQLADSARQIEELERSAGEGIPQGPESDLSLKRKITDLESELLRHQSDKKVFQQDNDELKEQLAAREEVYDYVVSELEVVSEARADIERELQQAKVKITIILDDAKSARLAEQTERQTAEGLVKKIPTLEQEAAGLRDALVDKATRLENSLTEIDAMQRELDNSVSEVETMRTEIEKREFRVRKSERIARLIEETREQVRIADLEERHDLHLSLAAVYAEDGQAEKARQQYLQALNVDPADATSHYKLANLYADVFGNKRMAVMHYRAYLKLSPDAEDVDEVKRWFTNRELN